MRHSRSILAAALALSAAACGQGATEPSALTTISGGTRAPAPSFDVGAGGGEFSQDGGVSAANTTGTDSTAITGGSGGRGLQYGGGQ
ncbi:MAG TPA: hypothetical protein VFR81_03395 [Longimicrobium sp.]|nr:hypothetical protein [Longimicrobium sp.]